MADVVEEKSFLNIGTEGEVARPKPFEPIAELNDMCCGSLSKVEVIMSDISVVNKKGETSTWEYAGCTIPVLMFHFNNFIGPNTDPQGVSRVFKYSESIIGSVTKENTPIADKSLVSLYESMWNRIKHILDTYSKECKVDLTKNVELNAAIKGLNNVNVIKGADKQVRIDAFTTLFTAVANALNTGFNGTPMFMRAEGVPIYLYMKLLADYNSHKFLTFPTFVGDGFLEVCRVNDKKYRINPPSMKIKTDESIVLKSETQGKLPNAPGSVGGDVIHPEITNPTVRAALNIPALA